MNLKTSEPFWLVKNGIINSYPSLRENHETEILVVGSGITGSLIAHQCISDGYETTLIDRREVANGSTSATTSMLQYEIDTPLCKLKEMIGEKGAVQSYWACYHSIDKLAEISKNIKSKAGFMKKKSLYFAAYKKDLPDLKKEYNAREMHDFPVKWLEAAEIEKLYGLKSSFGGILSDQGGSMDAFQFSHDLLNFNQKKGLKIFDKTNIKSVVYKKSGIKATTEFGNTISAKKIIYCNGFESVEVVKDDFVKLLSTYALVSEQSSRLPPKFDSMLFWNTSSPYHYLRSTDDGRILVGGEDEEFINKEKRDRLLDIKSKKLRNYVKKLLPDFDFRPDFTWAGIFGETKDGLPYIGEHPKFPGAYFVLGFGGNGITFSVIGMEMLSVHLKGGSHELEEFFRFSR